MNNKQNRNNKKHIINEIRYILAKFLLKNDPYHGIITLDRDVNISQEKHRDMFAKRKSLKSEGKNIIMCKASEIGKIVINKCLKLDLDINTQKLQKLLVLIQIECIEQSGYPFFSEDIRIWDCGVAIKEVDEDFRANGTKFSKEDKQKENLVLLDSEQKYIDTILEQYGNLTAIELNELPVIQKIIQMGETREGDTVPHINVIKLTEEFA